MNSTEIQEQMESLIDDLKKFELDNNVMAGTRANKMMLDLRVAFLEKRKDVYAKITQIREERKSGKL